MIKRSEKIKKIRDPKFFTLERILLIDEILKKETGKGITKDKRLCKIFVRKIIKESKF